jgi:hypothetical protein
MALSWNDIEPELQSSIEHGVVAIRRINQHEDFRDWLQVGQALQAMQLAAQKLSGHNATAGRAYNMAYKVIAAQVPDLAAINPTTRSHAIWLAANRESICAWHQRLPSNIRQQVNHPSTCKRRYERDTKPPSEKKPGASPTAKRDEAIRQLSEENDALKKRLANGANGDVINMKDKPSDIARVLFERHIPAKRLANIARELAKLEKSKPDVRLS